MKNEWMNECLNLRLEKKTEISFKKYYEVFQKKSFLFKNSILFESLFRYVF